MPGTRPTRRPFRPFRGHDQQLRVRVGARQLLHQRLEPARSLEKLDPAGPQLGDVGEEEPPPSTDRPEEPVDNCPVQQEL